MANIWFIWEHAVGSHGHGHGHGITAAAIHEKLLPELERVTGYGEKLKILYKSLCNMRQSRSILTNITNQSSFSSTNSL